MKKRTFCNPVNIFYRYERDYYSRESADPAVVLYHDRCFLFASRESGYFISDDLVNWEFIRVDLAKFPDFDLFAPAPVVVGDRMYITHSQGGNILYSDNPFDPSGWINIGKPYDWNDPAFLYDPDDGFVYVYEGLGDVSLHASKLDPRDNMRLVEGPVPVFFHDYKRRGYERRGDNNEEEGPPCLEGVWVNKIRGKYYLTYAVPGTEYSTYCDGCAVCDSPMGTFVNCDNSPVVFKPTGFLRGAGHGALFEDRMGHYWKIDTASISVNHPFERRIVLYPAKITGSGLLYTNTVRGDYPMFYPHETEDPFSQADAGLSLLSYGKNCTASSVLDRDHEAGCICDENIKTWWSAKTGRAGEWICMDLGKIYDISSVQVNFADQDIDDTHGIDHGYSYKYILEGSADGENFEIITDRRDKEDDTSHEYFEYESASYRFIRLTNEGRSPADGKFAISGLRVFGKATGSPPAHAPEFTALRDSDERNMTLRIDAVTDAQGYIIRFGTDKKELNTHFQIFSCEQEIRCLIAGLGYFVRVDAFNEGGITEGKVKTV